MTFQQNLHNHFIRAPVSVINNSKFSDDDSSEIFVIDTDGGVDDACAVAMALHLSLCASQNQTVHLIVTCFGNVSAKQSAVNMAKVLKHASCSFGRRTVEGIKIVIGSDDPLDDFYDLPPQWPGHGNDGLGDVIEDLSKKELKKWLSANSRYHSGAEAIVSIAGEFPGKVHLIMLGSLTNLALASALDTGLAKKLKAITILGGAIRKGNVTERGEFNFMLDPLAVNIVFRNFTKADVPVTVVPLEACEDSFLPWSVWEELKSVESDIADFFCHVFGVFEQVTVSEDPGAKGLQLYDVLAVLVAMRPEKTILNTIDCRCQTVTHEMRDEHTGESYRRYIGMLYGPEQSEGALVENHRVVLSIDQAYFIRQMQRLFRRGSNDEEDETEESDEEQSTDFNHLALPYIMSSREPHSTVAEDALFPFNQFVHKEISSHYEFSDDDEYDRDDQMSLREEFLTEDHFNDNRNQWSQRWTTAQISPSNSPSRSRDDDNDDTSVLVTPPSNTQTIPNYFQRFGGGKR